MSLVLQQSLIRRNETVGRNLMKIALQGRNMNIMPNSDEKSYIKMYMD